jgi:U3 small nucleolar RNA-associated protein 14
MICLIFSYVFFSTKLKKQVEHVLPGNGKWRDGGFGSQVAETMCINVSKCKNNKIKGGKKEADIRRITVQSQANSL